MPSDRESDIGSEELFRGLKILQAIASELQLSEDTKAQGWKILKAFDLIADGIMVELALKEREIEALREALRRQSRLPGRSWSGETS